MTLLRLGCGVAATVALACGVSASDSSPVSKIAPRHERSCEAFHSQSAVTLDGYTSDAMEPFVSKDGAFLLFNNSNAAADTDLYVATRRDGLRFHVDRPLEGVNSVKLDAVASLDRHGTLYFISNRSYDATLSTLYRARFAGGAAGVPALVPGVSLRIAGIVNFDAEISGNGRTLWFDDGRYVAGGVLKAATIVVADRQGDGFVRRPNGAAILRTVNTTGLNYAPSISADGLEVFFTRVDPAAGATVPAIYCAMRDDPMASFGAVRRLVAATGFVEAPTLSADGRFLYYHRRVDGVFQIFRLQR